MDVSSYLLLRTPSKVPRLSEAPQLSQAGKVSGRRIALSLLGIVIGIVASFFVTGIRPASSLSDQASITPGSIASLNGGEVGAGSPRLLEEPIIQGDWSLRRFLQVGLIALVICGLTYQGLYFSLRLYENEPAFLVVFVAFQYGYFWQSAIHVAGRVAAANG